MGSDLSMESERYRYRPVLMFLNGDDQWEIYKDSFYSGYNLSFTAPNNETSRDIFESLGYKVADTRPAAVLGRHEKS